MLCAGTRAEPYTCKQPKKYLSEIMEEFPRTVSVILDLVQLYSISVKDYPLLLADE